jgi:uncharacterized protein YybS (DUF2232 family)
MKTTNIIGFAGSVILVLSLSMWMPFFGPAFGLIIPLPFLFFFSKLGLKEGLTAGVVSLLIVGILGSLIGEPQLGLYASGFAIFGLIVSELFKRPLSMGVIVFFGTAFMLFMGVSSLFFAGMTKNQSLGDVILGYFQSNLSEYVKVYESSGLDQEKLAQIKQAFSLLSKLIARIYPAIIIIGTGLLVWINVVLSKPLFRMGKVKYPSFADADKWCAPELLVWGIIGSGFALFLPATGIRFIAENVLLVLFVIYVFHGLSITMFFFNKRAMPRWARIGIYALIILQQLFLILLAVVGLFDQWVDFRKLRKKTDPELETK